MKRVLVLLAALAVALSPASCSKQDPTPEELSMNELTMAKIAIHTKSEYYQDTVTPLQNAIVYETCEMDGNSWFMAMSGGRRVYDSFMISLYFDSISKMKVGDRLRFNSVLFSFILSSNSNATTDSCEGTVTLAARSSDYVVLHFESFRFTCSMGEYVIDGYLKCPSHTGYPSLFNGS